MDINALTQMGLAAFLIGLLMAEEWNYQWKWEKLSGDSLTEATATAIDNMLLGRECNPCERRWVIDAYGSQVCRRTYRILEKSDRDLTSRKYWQLLCGKLDYSEVKECEFYVGDTLTACKKVLFDFHDVDKPNPCDNNSLLISFREKNAKNIGSCVPPKMEVFIESRTTPTSKTTLLARQEKITWGFTSPGSECELELSALDQTTVLNQWVSLEIDNSRCEFFYAFDSGTEPVKYEIKSIYPEKGGGHSLKKVRFHLNGALRTFDVNQREETWNTKYEMYELIQEFSYK